MMKGSPMRSTDPAHPMRARGAPLLAVAVLVVAGCGGPTGPSDAARPDASTDASGAPPARVSLHVSVDLEALEDDTVLDHAILGIDAIHAPYDRGRLEMRPAEHTTSSVRRPRSC
jgi:hypothetical protein